jgi:hypothetical protein
MRKSVLAAALAILCAAGFWTAPAGAMALPAPAGLGGAAKTIDPVETVACRAVWRCGPYGCGWRRVCYAPRYYGGPRYYRPYRYGYRPYVRPYRSYDSRPYYRPYRPYYRTYGYRHRPYYAPRPYYAVRPYDAPRPYFGQRVIYGPYGYGVYDPRNVWW